MITRRSLLKYLTFSTLMGILNPLKIPKAFATAHAEKPLETTLFLDLSREATGFETLPEESGAIYLSQLKKQSPKKMQEILHLFRNGMPVQEIVQEDPQYKTILEEIIRIWYTGDITGTEKSIAADSYTNGLAWKAAGITPMGVPYGQNWSTPLQ